MMFHFHGYGSWKTWTKNVKNSAKSNTDLEQHENIGEVVYGGGPLSPAEAVKSHVVGRIYRQLSHEMDAIPSWLDFQPPFPLLLLFLCLFVFFLVKFFACLLNRHGIINNKKNWKRAQGPGQINSDIYSPVR